MIHLLQTGVATLEDGDLLDIQNILDPTMSTAQSLGELAIRFFLNLLVCWILVHFSTTRRVTAKTMSSRS